MLAATADPPLCKTKLWQYETSMRQSEG